MLGIGLLCAALLPGLRDSHLHGRAGREAHRGGPSAKSSPTVGGLLKSNSNNDTKNYDDNNSK